MAVTRLNHAVLYVRDAGRTAAFYRDVLGFRPTMELPGGKGVFMQAPASTNDHDIAFFSIGAQAGDSPAGRTSVGLYHLAWEVATLADLRDLRAKLDAAGALAGASDHGTTKSLYARDPDGIEFEVVWLIPAHLLDDEALAAAARGILPLDLDAEIARFGADTRGGLGISIPLGVGV